MPRRTADPRCVERPSGRTDLGGRSPLRPPERPRSASRPLADPSRDSAVLWAVGDPFTLPERSRGVWRSPRRTRALAPDSRPRAMCLIIFWQNRNFPRHFRDSPMKVPGSGLPDLEGPTRSARRGWAAHVVSCLLLRHEGLRSAVLRQRDILWRLHGRIPCSARGQWKR